MKIYYSDAHTQHTPTFEVFDGGEKVPSLEVPERAEQILRALRQTPWAEICPPTDFGLDPILAVHDAGYLNFLRTAYAEWLEAPLEAAYEKTALLPATFPPAGWRGHVPRSLLGRAGYYMMDLSAPIVAGTYPAALAAAQCALSGAQAISASVSPLQNPFPNPLPAPSASPRKNPFPNPFPPAAFALCRPPGHHAGRANCGGYCYLNNAAIAAHWLSQTGKVALLDIDYHAGNGTQDIFYTRADVLTISIHADPDDEYPHYCGYADETGSGPGLGFHRNFPLPAGTEVPAYLETLRAACELIRAFQPQFLVISAGMDIYCEDPLGKIRITTAGIAQIGSQIASLNLPSLVVFEGGYHNAALGQNIVAFLENFNRP